MSIEYLRLDNNGTGPVLVSICVEYFGMNNITGDYRSFEYSYVRLVF